MPFLRGLRAGDLSQVPPCGAAGLSGGRLVGYAALRGQRTFLEKGAAPRAGYFSFRSERSASVASRIERANPPPQAIRMSSVVRDDTRPVRIS